MLSRTAAQMRGALKCAATARRPFGLSRAHVWNAGDAANLAVNTVGLTYCRRYLQSSQPQVSCLLACTISSLANQQQKWLQ